MVNRGGRICLAAFPAEPVPVDLAYLVRNNIYVFGIRGEGRSATHRAAALMAQKRFDAKLIHTHTFPLAEVPTAITLRARAHRGRDQGGRENVPKPGCEAMNGLSTWRTRYGSTRTYCFSSHALSFFAAVPNWPSW